MLANPERDEGLTLDRFFAPGRALVSLKSGAKV
jgi:hypothetical protein